MTTAGMTTATASSHKLTQSAARVSKSVATPLTVIEVTSLAQLPPCARLLETMPDSGQVYVYKAPTPIGGDVWRIIAVSEQTKESE